MYSAHSANSSHATVQTREKPQFHHYWLGRPAAYDEANGARAHANG
jgi:hypothetical protein